MDVPDDNRGRLPLPSTMRLTSALRLRAPRSGARLFSSLAPAPVPPPPAPLAPTVAPAPAPPAAAAAAAARSYARQDDRPTRILAADKWGFNVNNVRMRGSILAFADCTLLWAVTSVRAISPRSLAPVHMLRPRAEVCLIGTGDAAEDVNPALFGYMSRRGVALEVMTTAHAIATFNVLVAEGRPVCAALVSRAPVSRDDACLYSPDADAPVSARDRELLAALATDAAPVDRDRLLGDGRGDAEREREEEARSARAAHDADTARALAAAAASAKARRADLESVRLSREFGVPGFLYRDPRIFLDDRRAAAAAAEEEGDAAELALSRRAARRSFK